jgi:hypothetical protein
MISKDRKVWDGSWNDPMMGPGAPGMGCGLRTWTGEMTLAAKHLLHFQGFDRRR